MKKRFTTELFGGNDIRESIFILGKRLYIKLLTAYEMILCSTMALELSSKIKKNGVEDEFATTIAENACLVYMCLYTIKDKRVFKDGFDALSSLTLEEMQKITDEYIKVKERFIDFSDLDYGMLEDLKKN